MSVDIDLENARKEVQRKVGRNLMLYQQIEHMLKFLVENAKLSGSSIDEFSNYRETRKHSVKTKSMGLVVDPFLETMFPSSEGASSSVEDEKSHVFEFSFSIEESDTLNKNSKRLDLSGIISDRNDLVHHFTQIFKSPDTVEGWLEIDSYLESKRDKLMPEYKLLQNLIKNLQEDRKELAERLQDEV